jgi:hypothetical protein
VTQWQTRWTKDGSHKPQFSIPAGSLQTKAPKNYHRVVPTVTFGCIKNSTYKNILGNIKCETSAISQNKEDGHFISRSTNRHHLVAHHHILNFDRNKERNTLRLMLPQACHFLSTERCKLSAKRASPAHRQSRSNCSQ